MRGCIIGFAVLLATLMLFSFVQAMPPILNYQGRLTDGGGNPIAVTTTVEFRIWSDSIGGTQLWMESRSITPDANGLFSTLLGTISPVPDSAFAGAGAYLGIKVGLSTETIPRSPISPVAYAFRVGTVDGAAGGTISGELSVGSGNTNTGTNTFVAGNTNAVSGFYSVVGGGWLNTASNNQSTVSGGYLNTASGPYSAVGGGGGNIASAQSTTIGGGSASTAQSIYATVAGGNQNNAVGAASSVGGGTFNTTGGWRAHIGGGFLNNAAGDHSVIAGGESDSTTGQYAAIGGGYANHANGTASIIPGGQFNTALGNNSLAAGYRAKANHHGTFVWADHSAVDFASTAADQFLIRATGGVGIGTNSPGAGLHVKGPGFPKAFGYFDTDATAQDAGLRFYEAGVAKSHVFHEAATNTLNLYGDGYAGIAITAFGAVGIGTTSPNYLLDVRGTIGNNASLYHSDLRWKRNVHTLSGALDKVQRLRGVSFDWRRNEFADMNFPEGSQIGLIAQEVEEVVPEVVNTAEDGFKSVDYSKLVALLIEANKDQQRQIDELKLLVSRLVSESENGTSALGMK